MGEFSLNNQVKPGVSPTFGVLDRISASKGVSTECLTRQRGLNIFAGNARVLSVEMEHHIEDVIMVNVLDMAAVDR